MGSADDTPDLRRIHPLKIFEVAKSQRRPAYISAPMVRYSKLAYRHLMRDYGVDICYTPMILAKEFNRSSFARDSDFTTSTTDTPVIAQFGSNSPLEFARAASLVQPYVDGVDLNCGCPQTWACQDGIGAALIRDRGLVADIVKAAKEQCGRDFCVSVKIRIHKDLRETVDFVRTVETAGVDFIGVHGRLKGQRSSTPPNLEAIKLCKESVNVPIVANGDAYTLADVRSIAATTGADGVMAARGILENPALFAGYDTCPEEAVERFLVYAMGAPLPFKLLLHHLSEMTLKMISKKDRLAMLACRDTLDVIDWLRDHNLLQDV